MFMIICLFRECIIICNLLEKICENVFYVIFIWGGVFFSNIRRVCNIRLENRGLIGI